MPVSIRARAVVVKKVPAVVGGRERVMRRTRRNWERAVVVAVVRPDREPGGSLGSLGMG
ncbi:hypothetical protein Aph01nite_36910 [Acrocarpospora phusangensis]|uniref:Uncharacterized protein n=1 Tax=Acrocarpospora phusangensis TaxID=1070424 RepID=A0A919UKT2_9ACTN|nr:hypothetical protein Aph01nite_36910 [Acrocarpospora phusangensis]